MVSINIVVGIVLIILSILMLFPSEETTSKFFLSKTSTNEIATIMFMIGILFILSYFSGTVTSKLISKLRTPNSVTTVAPEVLLEKPVQELTE